MAIYDPTTPPMFLSGTVTSSIGRDRYTFVDETQISFTGAYLTFSVIVESIAFQTIGTAETRSGTAKQYNALDIKGGDWLVTANGQIILQVLTVTSKTTTSVSFIARDTDMVTYKTYADNYLSAGNQVAFFELSDNRQPMITGPTIQSFFSTPIAIDRVQGRFAAEEETERYRFEFPTSQLGFNKGDIITVSETSGQFVKLGSPNASRVPVGVVLEKIMNSTVIYVKPFNTIIDNHTAPELLTAEAGEIYYADPANPGAMTSSYAPGLTPLFLQIKNPVVTRVQSTLENNVPTANDVIVLNTIRVFDGAQDSVPASVQALVDLINQSTASHGVTASVDSEFASVTSQSSSSTVGVSTIVVSDNSGSSFNALTVNFSDGTTQVQVTFDQNSGVTLTPYPSATNYLTFTASSIATVLNSAFTANGVKLVASAILPGDGPEASIYGQLVIEATEAAASINISGTDTDAFGNNFINAMGIAAVTSPVSKHFLVLDRLDGGDIMITGAGQFINSNGIASSSAGDAAILMMLEGVDREEETGVSTSVDKNQQVVAATLTDHFVTGIDIDYTPFSDGDVTVKVNGIEVNTGDGDNTDVSYFTDPSDPDYNENGVPMPARLIRDIQAGDVLIWNPSAAGYALDPSDDIDIVYHASSYDL